jgi:hypothetical protein
MVATEDVAAASRCAALLGQELFYTTAMSSEGLTTVGTVRVFSQRFSEKAQKLNDLLNVHGVRAALSLANPQPVTAGDQLSESYAVAVLLAAQEIIRNYPDWKLELDDDQHRHLVIDFPNVPYDVVAHVKKEFERCTGTAFHEDAETEKQIAPIETGCRQFTRSPPCPDCGSPRRVVSTRDTFRYVKCDTCNVTKKLSKPN